MIIRRKLFSKEEKQERSKSDITSDVAVGGCFDSRFWKIIL